MRELGLNEYREVLHGPYRMMHWIDGSRVHVVAVFDGRRDLEQILARRLLR